MTTNVSFFAPYIVEGKALKASVINRDGSTQAEFEITEANRVCTVVIHDSASLHIDEVDRQVAEEADDSSASP